MPIALTKNCFDYLFLYLILYNNFCLYINEDILRFPFDFCDSALKYFMDETNDAAFEEEMKKYEFFENAVDKNGDYKYR